MDPLAFSEERFRPSLEERLESIISGAALMADSSCTRDDRRERIVAECNSVRQALQDLLSEYMGNVSVSLSFASRLRHMTSYSLPRTQQLSLFIFFLIYTLPSLDFLNKIGVFQKHDGLKSVNSFFEYILITLNCKIISQCTR